MEIRSQMHPPSEVAGALQADPQGLGTGRTIGFTTQVAAEASDPAEHGRQRRRDHRRGPAVNGDIDRLPFGGVQDGVAGQLGGGPPQHGQGLNPPGDDQVQGQGGFQAVQGAKESSKNNLNTQAVKPNLEAWRLQKRLKQSMRSCLIA